MNIALTTWDDHISPVFDTAQELLLVEADGETVISRRREPITASSPQQRIARLRDLHVDVLICGAISRVLADMIMVANIRLIPFIAGETEEALAAWLTHDLPCERLLMPGCCARGAGRRNRRKEHDMMNGGRGGGRGRMGGPVAGGPVGLCVCPQCKEEVAHQRGVPCSAQTCPKCGASLVRSS